jgi:hypothetical protein
MAEFKIIGRKWGMSKEELQKEESLKEKKMLILSF